MAACFSLISQITKQIIEETTRAALKMEYPIKKLAVYVLDDGKSKGE